MHNSCSTEGLVLTRLVSMALHGVEEMPFPQECNAEKLQEIIYKQQLSSMVWPVISRQKDDRWKQLAQRMDKGYQQLVLKSLTQKFEIDALKEAMEQEGMDCLPLKGPIMQNYYPDPTYRSMGDFDVLLKDFDRDRVKAFMLAQGYDFGDANEDYHDSYFKKPRMCVEVHSALKGKSLVEKVSAAEKWMAGLWERCKPINNKKHIYQMKLEDFYIHLLLHMYENFNNKGTGLRSLVDLYVFLQAEKENMDWSYLNGQLKELKLQDFSDSMERIGNACFSKEQTELDNDSALVLEFFVDGGIYGSRKNQETLRVARDNSSSYAKKSLSAKMKVVFQPAKVLKRRYPVLKKCPWLLPAIWVVRVFRIAFLERDKIKMVNEAGSKEEYNKMKDIFKAAGINSSK